MMSMMGHRSSGLALDIYARKMTRSRDTGTRLDALVRGAEWAQATAFVPIDEELTAVGVDARERNPA